MTALQTQQTYRDMWCTSRLPVEAFFEQRADVLAEAHGIGGELRE